MTTWYKFCYKHSWLAVTGIVVVIMIVIAALAGCTENTGNGGSMPNCGINQHVASKFKGDDVVWYCAKGAG